MDRPAKERFEFSVIRDELGKKRIDRSIISEDQFLHPYVENSCPRSSSPCTGSSMDVKDPSACVTSCSEPLLTISTPSSIWDSRPVAGEITLKNMHEIALTSRFNSFRQRHLQNLCELPRQYIHLGFQDSSYVVINGGEENSGTSSGIQLQKPLAIQGINECLVLNRLSEETEKTVKGKGIVSGFIDESENWNGEKLTSGSKDASDAFMELTSTSNKLSLHCIKKSGLEVSHDGTNLRELLKPGFYKLNKFESLQLFRQIVELVDFAHSQDVVLLDLRPSCFFILSSSGIRYVGSSAKGELLTVLNQGCKRKRTTWEQDELASHSLSKKQQKLGQDTSTGHPPFSSSQGLRSHLDLNGTSFPESIRSVGLSNADSSHQTSCMLNLLEQKWYTSPEELTDRGCSTASNIYSLGILLFELLCSFPSWEGQCEGMSNLNHRILPPKFLSGNPNEAGFCLWLLHPEHSLRPKTREILQSEFLCSPSKVHQRDYNNISASENDAESELLLYFLVSLKSEKLKRAAKLVEDIGHIEEDLKEVQRKFLSTNSSSLTKIPREFHSENLGFNRRPYSQPTGEKNLSRNVKQLEEVYLSVRSQLQIKKESVAPNPDKGSLRSQERWSEMHYENREPIVKQSTPDLLGSFFDGLCKFSRYSKFEVLGVLRSGDLLNTTNVIRSIGFSRDEDYIAAAGVSKKIKVYEFDSLLDDSIDVHYPAVEMSNNSKLSCVCWNSSARNFLASTDYNGVVQIWDADTAQGLSQHMEHQKRAWSVDFSQADPMLFASGSDDCSVKLWGINEKNSVGTIWNPANVCCVQFSPHSGHRLSFGCADNKIYCYDLRQTRVPWCTLTGHGKTVSYVKFLDSESLVSASTDNTLKLWDLKKASPDGLYPNACTLAFRGHTNEKNFVGLSVLDGYIACGSETNEVYAYYRSLPMPITSHAFGSSESFSGAKVGNDDGSFVSSVCWGRKTGIIVAANSAGSLKLLKMV